VITTNDPSLARKLRALRNHGQDPDASAPDFIMPGFNYRITEFQAALGLTQMTKLERIITARRRIAANYDQLLAKSPLQVPHVTKGSDPVYQSYVVLLPEHLAAHRSRLIGKLRELGIETTIGTYHMPMTTYFRNRYGYQVGDFPIADQVFARSLTLPVYEALSTNDQRQVITQLLEQVA
jgi:perosamine synthetase